MKIVQDSIVFMHYTLADDQGQVIDSSAGGQPMPYLHGHGNIVPGLEKALEGMEQGESTKVSIAPEEGYGLVDPQAVQLFALEAFENIDEIKPGMQFHAEGPEGQVQVITVREIREDGVLIDRNHPLAGKTLNFEVEITEVREATAGELEHGHPHTSD